MITLQGILVGTGVLWALNLIIVAPLTQLLVTRRLSMPAYAHVRGNPEAAKDLPEFKSLVVRSYMQVDTLVLGIAGFLFGSLLGWSFFGISFEAKGWPGMIAFILMSLAGASVKA